MASLLSLPLELLVEISAQLSTPDLCSLRITCKQVERSLYEWFSSEFFTKKQFMLSYESLQTLIEIANHKSLSQKLTHVIIGTNVYVNMPLRFRNEDAAAKWIEGMHNQRALLSNGDDREMLTEAFQALPNLQVVGIRDFNANNRARDGQSASWSSWGATTVYRETGIQVQFMTNNHGDSVIDFTARTFQNIMYALAKAKSKPQEVEVLLRQGQLADDAFHIPRFSESTMVPLLLNLKRLLLSVNTSPRLLHSHTNGQQIGHVSGRSLRRFLAYTPNLAFLRLNMHKWTYQPNEDFLKWLASPVDSSATPSPTDKFLDPPPIDLPHLKCLEFGQLDVRPEVIYSVVHKFAPTLVNLSLWRMSLSRGKSNDSKPNFWADLVRNLASMSILRLKSFKVGMVQQDGMHVNWRDGNDEPLLKQMEYTGLDMHSFLNKVADEAVVAWPIQVEHDDADEDMDSDADMDDMHSNSDEEEDGDGEDDDA